jgi:hypothetical protein
LSSSRSWSGGARAHRRSRGRPDGIRPRALRRHAPGIALALDAFGLAGAVNAPVLRRDARPPSEYAFPWRPRPGFRVLRGLKIAPASARTALGGSAAGFGARVLLAATAAVTLAAATLAVDRWFTT